MIYTIAICEGTKLTPLNDDEYETRQEAKIALDKLEAERPELVLTIQAWDI